MKLITILAAIYVVISRAVAIYILFGLLTFLAWAFFSLSGSPFDTGWWDGPFSRGPVTVVFGPIVFVSWPDYWACMLPVGGDWFAWHPGAAIIGGMIWTIMLAVVMDDIVEDIRRLGRAYLRFIEFKP